MKRIILSLLSILVFLHNAYAQTCNGTWAPPIVDQTFGQGQAGVQFYSPLSTYAPGVTTSTTFITSGPSDNYSCLTDNASNGQPGSWCNTTDHTGNPYGLMFEINAPSSGGTVFVSYTMDNLCPNTTLQLGVWILNIDGGTYSGQQYPNMTMEVIDSVTNTVLDSVETGNVPFDCTWHQYTTIFNNGSSSTVTLKFINNSVGSGFGNDLALDDITVSPCVPLATLTPQQDSVCSGVNIPFTATISGNVYSPATYQWQYSADQGATWIDAGAADTSNIYNFSSTTPGTYWVRFFAGPEGFAGNSSCSATSDTAIVTINPYPLPPPITGDTIYCPGEALQPFTVAGQNILWYASDSGGTGSASQPVVNYTVPGDYTYYATQTINGCESGRDSISILVGPGAALNPALTNTQPNTCFFCNGKITLHGIIPGYVDTVSYQLNGVLQTSFFTTAGSDSTITLTNLCPGVYSDFTVTEQQCVANIPGPDTLAIAPLNISIAQTVNPTACGVCDGTIILQGVVPSQNDIVNYLYNGNSHSIAVYSDSNGNITLNHLCQGTYDSITVKADVCSSSVISQVILSAPPLQPAFTYVVYYGCNGDTVIFTNTSQNTDSAYYRWDFGDNTDNDTAFNAIHIYHRQDTFYATLFMSNIFCIDSITDTIPLIHPLKAGFTISGDTVCQGSPVTFTNTSIGITPSYLWDFGDGTTDITTSPTHTYANTGAYKVSLTETDFVPCQDTASAWVQVDSASGISLTLSDSAICEGKAIDFTGAYTSIGNTAITWNFGDGSVVTNVNPVQHSYDTMGIFTVTLSANYRACPDTNISAQVHIYPYPLVDIGPDTSMCPGQSFSLKLTNLSIQTHPSDYINIWSNGDTAASIVADAVGSYWLTVTTDKGCTISDTMEIKPNCYMGIPNAFTPNGDGINDYFFPRQLLADGLVSFKMEIYNRWGEQVFATTNTDGRGWDGKFNGVIQPEGVFIYIIDATFKNGQTEHHQGTVTLLR